MMIQTEKAGTLGPFQSVEEASDRLIAGGSEFFHTVIGAYTLIEQDTYATAPPPVPQEVTMRQARLALLGAGLLDKVSAVINALPSPQREAAQIEWEYSQTVQRDSSFVTTLAPVLDLSDAHIDRLFIAAAAM